MQQTTSKRPLPFSMSYVFSKTLEGMKSAVSFSISKTLSRLDEFPYEDPKRQEVLETLSLLSEIQQLVTSFESENKHLLQ